MKKTFASIAVIIIATFSLFCTAGSDKKDNMPPKYVFLFIGDGMGVNQVAATNAYLSYKSGKTGGELLGFCRFPYSAFCTTYSNDNGTTCSSAAGTAIATGHKTNNNYLGVDPEGNKLESIACELKKRGYRIGIMSNVPVNHATPAAFYGHSDNRSDYYTLTNDLAVSGFEFFAGSGFLDFYGKDGDMKASDELVKESGYAVAWGKEEFDSIKDTCSQVVLCQAYNKGKEPENYDIANIAPEGNMSLEETFAECLAFIGEEKPFFIMCEGGTIDWNCHANNTMATVTTVIDFDKAISRAYEFYLAHPDETLIVVTADHETGGLALGCNGRYASVDWESLENRWISDGYKMQYKADELKGIYDNANVSWSSTGHTGSPVPVYAVGKGGDKFTGTMDNTQIKGKILGE